MSALAITQQEIATCRTRHARYLAYVKDSSTSAGKAYWLAVAAEVRLQLAEALDMLYWLTMQPTGKRAAFRN